jgi:hypothetical protein
MASQVFALIQYSKVSSLLNLKAIICSFLRSYIQDEVSTAFDGLPQSLYLPKRLFFLNYLPPFFASAVRIFIFSPSVFNLTNAPALVHDNVEDSLTDSCHYLTVIQAHRRSGQLC